jgi:hypothetical protein
VVEYAMERQSSLFLGKTPHILDEDGYCQGNLTIIHIFNDIEKDLQGFVCKTH